MPQPTVGYGKFYYGRALYGQMQIASGQITSTWTESSTPNGSLHAIAKNSGSTWTWTSSAVGHPTDDGRIPSNWAWYSNLLHGWIWGSARTGVLHAAAVVTEQWTWSVQVVGTLFWTPVGPDTPVPWTPSTPGSDPWTPVTYGTDPWTPVKKYN